MFNAKVEGISMPLMTLVDYMGFRLIAMSILPISRQTIVCGSSDCGQVKHEYVWSFFLLFFLCFKDYSFERFSHFAGRAQTTRFAAQSEAALLRRSAQETGQSVGSDISFVVGHKSLLRYGPCDLEGHESDDGRFYLLDFSRMMPPEVSKRIQLAISFCFV